MRHRLLVVFLVPFIISACGGSPSAPTIDQRGNNTQLCVVTLPQGPISVSATAGPSSIAVTAASNCGWTATSSQAFLTITSGSGGTGSGTITFTVAENTGAARSANITVNGVTIAINQAAGVPPVTVVAAGGVPGNVVAGQAINVQFTAAGGNGGPYTFGIGTGTGFAPIGWTLSSNGLLAGVTQTAGTAAFEVCATDTGGRRGCLAVNITITPPAVTGPAFLGNWSGNIVLQVGCFAPLPANFPWTGTFTQQPNGQIVFTVTVPRALVLAEPHNVTVTGQRMQFNVDFDSNYTFTADFSADFRSLSGTFTGGNCNVPPTIVNPSGTWTGTRQ